MQIGYLGPLEVRDGDRTVAVPGQRLRQLLSRLAQQPGRWVSTGALAEAVWAADLPADPANSLQSLVSRLRRVLDRPELVEQSPAGYRLTLAREDVDAERFTRLVAEGRARLVAGDEGAAADLIDRALALWRGTPLADDDSPEAAGRRSVLEDLLLDAQRDRASLAVREGRAGEVVPVLEELAGAHPLREDLALTLIDALVSAGRPAEALTAYERVRATLAETLGADPSPALQARQLDVLRMSERVARPPTNLRAAMTTFVGRDDDVRVVRERLGSGRLVTVVGTGGSGKTRLAAEVARGILDSATEGMPVPDGVWIIELAPVTDPDALPQAVLESIGIREIALPDPHADRPHRDARARMLEALATTSCLLIVDNCEHLVEAAADTVAEILGRCPSVRVLATSREPLGIDGELLHPLGPLAVPADHVPAAQAATVPAVQLLLDRARAVAPDIALDGHLVEIARRLDGLPLAIELAAARMRVLTSAEVAARLADRFRLLTGGRRTATPRHRTLRAVVEWSWELLTDREREVAEHVAVFNAGATEEAVGAVTPSWRGGAGPEDLTDVLHALVDKSLLGAVHAPDGTRYRMLETLREYGADRLAEQGLITAARTAHARWFTELVERQDPRLRTAEQLEALAVLDGARDDVLAALRFIGDAGDGVGAVDIVVHLGWYWLLRESGQEATRWTGFALEVPGAREAPGGVLAEALQTVLGFAVGTATVDVRAARQRFVDLAGRLDGDPHPGAKVLAPMLLFMGEEREAADAAIDEVLADPDPWVRAAGRLARLAHAENNGDVELMRRDGDAGVAEWEAIGDRWGLATLLSFRGQLRTLDGDLLGAGEDFQRARQYIRQLGGNSSDDVFVTMRLADLRLRAGDTTGAREHLAVMRSQRSFGEGRQLHRILVAGTEGAIAVIEKDDAGVGRALDELRDLLSTLGEPSLLNAHGGAVGHAVAAGLALRLGLPDEAAEHVRKGYAQALLTNDKPILAAVGMAVANWARVLGRHREAAVLVGASTRLRGTEDATSPSVIELVTALRADLGAEYDVANAEGLALSSDAAEERIAPENVQPAVVLTP